jgi:hypothetical protein
MTTLVHVSSKGKQDYVTPQDFVDHVGFRHGYNLLVDLAADENNRRCKHWIGLDQHRDSLDIDWASTIMMAGDSDLLTEGDAAGWLNPPFKGNRLFAPKCHLEKDNGARFITLTLSSLGTTWFREHFKNNALNLILEDRLIFEGQTEPYPKELMLSIWGSGMSGVSWYSYERDIQ